MELHRLECYVKLVESGSFSGAAEQLYLTQSALSKQIMALEKQLGVSLFDRKQRTPTSAGLVFYPGAVALLDQYSRLLDQIRPYGEGLRIAALPVMAHYGFTDQLARFMRQHPQINVEVEEADNAVLAQRLERGACDLIFVRSKRPQEHPWRYLPLCKDELALIVPRNHPLAGRGEVSLKEFSSESFIFLSRSTNLYDSCMTVCRAAGFEPRVLYVGFSGESIAQLVGQGGGVAIFMRQVALGLRDERLAVLRFSETIESWMVLAAQKTNRLPAAARLFWEFMRDSAQKPLL